MSGDASGENRVVDDEARLLAEGGHAVSLWEPEPDGLPRGAMQSVSAGVGAIWSSGAARHIRSRIRSHRPDVVHLHNLYPALSPSVIRVATQEHVPVVVTLHNYRLLCLPGILRRDGQACESCVGHLPLAGVVHRCYRDSLMGSAAVAGSLMLHRGMGTFGRVSSYLAVSGFVRDKYIEGGFDPASITVKSNFAWPTPRRTGVGSAFVFAGRLAEDKGPSTLIDAWRPAFGRLIVAGDGIEEAALRAAAPPEVEFLGRVSPARVQALLGEARALLVPSRSFEGQPRSIIEAYAAGVPVIASRVGAIPEVVEDGGSGVLVDTNDGWSAALAELATDDEANQRMGERALALWEERFAPKRALSELEAAYESARARASRSNE